VNLHDTAAALLSYALQSGLLLIVGILLPRALRLRHPRTLFVYWRLLLIAVLALPLVTSVWRPSASLPTLAIEGLTIEQVVATALPAAAPGFSWRAVLVVVVGVTLFALARLAAGLVFLHRCRRGASPLTPTPDSIIKLRLLFIHEETPRFPG
jgi:hypothetical protein